MRRRHLIGRFASTAFGLVFSTGLWAAQVSSSYSVDTDHPVDPDLGVRVPAGFEATVFAQTDGYARHMAVRDDGTLYLALTVRMGAGSTMGIVAMRDTDGDGVADVTEHFAANIPGTELRFHDGDLYLGSKTAVYRFNFAGDELVPTGEPEIVVDGFPEQRLHEAKTFAIEWARFPFETVLDRVTTRIGREVDKPVVIVVLPVRADRPGPAQDFRAVVGQVGGISGIAVECRRTWDSCSPCD